MLRQALAAEVLACPACRGMVGGRYVDHPLIMGEILAEDPGGAVRHGFLRCRGCGARYPIVDGVPIVLRDVSAWLRQQERPVLGRDDLPHVMSAWLLRAWDDDQDPNWRRQMLAIYASDLAPTEGTPAPELTALRDRGRALLRDRRKAMIAELGERPWVLDVGTAVGAAAIDLAGHGARVIALDHDFGPLRLLASLLRDRTIDVPRWRHGGFDYVARTLSAPEGVGFAELLPLAADATDPPLRPGLMKAITAYNVLDNVTDPVTLLRQLNGVLAPGGILAVSSPFDFVSRLTPPDKRLGDGVRSAASPEPDPARALSDLLTGRLPSVAPELKFAIRYEDRDVPWVLSRYDRSAHVFRCAYVEATKPGPTDR